MSRQPLLGIFLTFFLMLCGGTCWAEDSPPLSTAPGVFRGPARIVDGDSLLFGPIEVRILCLDAVELHQNCTDGAGQTYPCGVLAKKAMEQAIGGADVSCFGQARDKYNRPLVHCRARGTDLAMAMVQGGWAIGTCGPERRAARVAKEAKIGIWQGPFQRPATWRKHNPRTDKAKDPR